MNPSSCPSHLWHDSLSFVTWLPLINEMPPSHLWHEIRCNTLQVIDRYHQRHGDPNLQTILPHLQVTQKSVSQYVAVSCSELQCVAECCRVLQSVASTGNSKQSYILPKRNLYSTTATHCIKEPNWLTHSPLAVAGLHTVTHCNTLQQLTATTHGNTLQHTATHCKALQHTVRLCNILQHTLTHCRRELESSQLHPLNTVAHCNTLQHTATHCITLQLPTVLGGNLLPLHPLPYCTSHLTATHCHSLQAPTVPGENLL